MLVLFLSPSLSVRPCRPCLSRRGVRPFLLPVFSWHRRRPAVPPAQPRAPTQGGGWPGARMAVGRGWIITRMDYCRIITIRIIADGPLIIVRIITRPARRAFTGGGGRPVAPAQPCRRPKGEFVAAGGQNGNRRRPAAETRIHGGSRPE